MSRNGAEVWLVTRNAPHRDAVRTGGLTMVMDNGWPVSFVEGMMDQYGEYLDVVKIWDPHLRAPEKEVRRKIACFPQAVSAVTGSIQFDSTGTDLSATGSGAMSVECVELDEALKGCTPLSDAVKV